MERAVSELTHRCRAAVPSKKKLSLPEVADRIAHMDEPLDLQEPRRSELLKIVEKWKRRGCDTKVMRVPVGSTHPSTNTKLSVRVTCKNGNHKTEILDDNESLPQNVDAFISTLSPADR